MHSVIVSFALNGIDDRRYRENADRVAPAFADIPGLISKVWLADARSGTYGGSYLFTSADAAEAYLSSDLFTEAVIANPAFTDVTIRRCAVLDGPTATTSPSQRPAVAAG